MDHMNSERHLETRDVWRHARTNRNSEYLNTDFAVEFVVTMCSTAYLLYVLACVSTTAGVIKCYLQLQFARVG